MLSLAVSITTRNRGHDLRRTLLELQKQGTRPDQIVVCADGCSDDTCSMVRRDFPDVILIENAEAEGSIFSRDRILRTIHADLVLSLDDDSYPVEPTFVEEAARLFENNPKLGVAYFPQRSDEFPETLDSSTFGHTRPIGSFANSGAVIRRDLYLRLGGYPTFFFHAYEEPDFALRVWELGYQVCLFPHLTIRHHYTGSQRSEIRTHHRHARNELLSIVMRCPMSLLVPLALYRLVKQMGYAWKRGPGWLIREPKWWWSAAGMFPRAIKQRDPLPWKDYARWLCLLGNEEHPARIVLEDKESHAQSPRRSLRLGVSIATHNRQDDLRRTLDALRKLDPQPDEIWVCMDGCRDGTKVMLRNEYPWIKTLENNPSLGSIGSRDRIIRSAESELILSLDDDSYPMDVDFVARVKTLFEQDPYLGILYFPQRSDEFPESLNQEDFGRAQWIGSYANSGAVFRRDLYLRLPGYPQFFFHMYEEPDFALQVIAAGRQVIYYPELLIRHHYSSVQRNEIRIHHRHSRNEFWSVLMRCPMPWLPLISIYKLVSQFRYACHRGGKWVYREPLWWFKALAGIPTALRNRKPVSWERYRYWLMLMKEGIEVPSSPSGLEGMISATANHVTAREVESPSSTQSPNPGETSS